MTDYKRDLGDGRAIYVFDLTFGRARIGIGPNTDSYFDDVF